MFILDEVTAQLSHEHGKFHDRHVVWSSVIRRSQVGRREAMSTMDEQLPDLVNIQS